MLCKFVKFTKRFFFFFLLYFITFPSLSGSGVCRMETLRSLTHRECGFILYLRGRYIFTWQIVSLLMLKVLYSQPSNDILMIRWHHCTEKSAPLILEEYLRKHSPHSGPGAAQSSHSWESSSSRGKLISFTSTASIYPGGLNLPRIMIYRCLEPTSAASAPGCCWSALSCNRRWVSIIRHC